MRCSLRVDQNVGDVLDVADFVNAAPDLEQGISRLPQGEGPHASVDER